MRLRSVTGVTSVADDSTVTTSVTGATKMSDNMRHQGIVDDCTACMKDQLAELRAELTSERMGAEWVNERLARSEERNAGRDLHTQLGYNAELNAAIARIRDLCADLPRRRAWEIGSAERLVWDVLHILDGGTE